jgi:hypothetical protein
MVKVLVGVVTLLMAAALLTGLESESSTAHAASVAPVSHVAPGMHQGELLAVFGAPRSAGNAVAGSNDYWDGNICDSTGYCLNRTGGGRFIQMWLNSSSGAPDNYWYVRYIGTVSNSQTWPFTPGSGYNKAYNGEYVVNIDNGNGLCFQDAPGEGEGAMGRLGI